MLKKTVALGSLLTLMATSATLAHGHFRSGFLAGAHVGISHGSGSFNDTFDPNVAIRQAETLSEKAKKTSSLFGIFGGYRHIFHGDYTIGADIALNFFTNNELSKQFSYFNDRFHFRSKLSRRYNITPSINLGKVLCNRFHVYLGLGLAISKFKQQIDDIDESVSKNTSKTRVGFVPTVGVEYAVTHNVSIVGNVSYEIYRNFKKTFDVSASTLLPGSTYTSSIKPRYLTLKIGAAYRF